MLAFIETRAGTPRRPPVVYIHGGGRIAANPLEVEGFTAMGDSAGRPLAMMLGLYATNPDLISAAAPERTSEIPRACHAVTLLYGVLDRLSWLEDGFPGAEPKQVIERRTMRRADALGPL